MKDRSARARRTLKPVENLFCGAPAVDGEDSSASLLAFAENVLKHGNLCLPVRAQLRRAVESYFPDIPRGGQYPIEKLQLALALVRELGMQAESGPDPVGSI